MGAQTRPACPGTRLPKPVPDYCCATRSLAGEKLQIYQRSCRTRSSRAAIHYSQADALPVPRAAAALSPELLPTPRY